MTAFWSAVNPVVRQADSKASPPQKVVEIAKEFTRGVVSDTTHLAGLTDEQRGQIIEAVKRWAGGEEIGHMLADDALDQEPPPEAVEGEYREAEDGGAVDPDDLPYE